MLSLQTCYIKLYFQCDLIGQCSISEELIGFLECSVFCGDSIDRQKTVSYLQQATPTRKSRRFSDWKKSKTKTLQPSFYFTSAAKCVIVSPLSTTSSKVFVLKWFIFFSFLWCSQDVKQNSYKTAERLKSNT